MEGGKRYDGKVEQFAECFPEKTSHACEKSAAAAGLFPWIHFERCKASALGFFHIFIGFCQVIDLAEVDPCIFQGFGNFVFGRGFLYAFLLRSDSNVVLLRCLVIVGIGIDLSGKQGKSVDSGFLFEFAFLLFLRLGDVIDEVHDLRRFFLAEFFQPVFFLLFIASGVDDQGTAFAQRVVFLPHAFFADFVGDEIVEVDVIVIPGFFFREKFIQAKGVIVIIHDVVIIHDIIIVHYVHHVFVAGGKQRLFILILELCFVPDVFILRLCV